MSRINEILSAIDQDLSESNAKKLFEDIDRTCKGDRTNAFVLLCKQQRFPLEEHLSTLQTNVKSVPMLRSLLGGSLMHKILLHYGMCL